MNLSIDRSSHEPLFRQIADQLEQSILNGSVTPGEKLPTERHLASLLGVHRSTVTMAYDELRTSGLIQSKQGSGNYVRNDLWDFSPSFSRWQRYIQAGVFHSTQPLLIKIRELSLKPPFINFADGELAPDLLPGETFERLLREARIDRWLGYSDHRGEPYLRETLAVHLQKQYGIHAERDQVLVTSGCQQSLHLITQCLLSPGDCIGIEGPSYFYSLPHFVSAGIRLIRLPSDENGILPEAIPELHRKYRLNMLILTPTYHNPTGSVLSLDRRKELLRVCDELAIPIVEDDVYGAIRLDDADQPPPPLISMKPIGGNVIYLGSFSKTTAAGIRLGWIVGAPSVLERLADVKQQMDFGVSTLLQQIVDAFLTSGAWEEHFGSVRRALTGNRNVMLEALERCWGNLAVWTKPQGGYHVWCKLASGSQTNDTALLEQAIRKGVFYVPGRAYGAEHGYIRLSYARASREQIAEGVRLLGEIVAEGSLRK